MAVVAYLKKPCFAIGLSLRWDQAPELGYFQLIEQSAIERRVALAAEFCLDGPVLSTSSTGYEVDALIGAGRVPPFTDVRRHLTQ